MAIGERAGRGRAAHLWLTTQYCAWWRLKMGTRDLDTFLGTCLPSTVCILTNRHDGRLGTGITAVGHCLAPPLVGAASRLCQQCAPHSKLIIHDDVFFPAQTPNNSPRCTGCSTHKRRVDRGRRTPSSLARPDMKPVWKDCRSPARTMAFLACSLLASVSHGRESRWLPGSTQPIAPRRTLRPAVYCRRAPRHPREIGAAREEACRQSPC